MELQGFKPQRGVAMVEFAITLPLLLLLLLAIGEIARMLYQYNSLLQASRDAARFVAIGAWNSTQGKIDLTSDPQLVLQTKNLAVYGVPGNTATPLVSGLTSANVQVSAQGAEHVSVTISYTFVPVIGNGIPAFIGSGTALNFPLVATTVMRAL
ncbi:MAG: TadE/TadG family type IV pilus assembly protein [Pseudomonas sp.]|uniref:TadE family protein n=1 Tax=Pseudomonas sp. TaxID=306 RepID=UPI00273562A6|nr:TadE/TadG family type IV pilus assembly protein [Pseudomonas sp.]MDP3848067.1 TadE/TadG family type IV pilus assembly protein [Pseudomonas sp.]